MVCLGVLLHVHVAHPEVGVLEDGDDGGAESPTAPVHDNTTARHPKCSYFKRCDFHLHYLPHLYYISSKIGYACNFGPWGIFYVYAQINNYDLRDNPPLKKRYFTSTLTICLQIYERIIIIALGMKRNFHVTV